MADEANPSTEVALRPSLGVGEVIPIPEDLPRAIVENQRSIKVLQAEVMRRELNVQRAVEEQKLLQELQTLDEMTLHKIERNDGRRKNRMALSADSLARIVELQDAIKLASVEEERLQSEEKRIIKDAEMVEAAIADVDRQLTTTIENTGYDGRGGRPYEALENVYRRHQIELAGLEQEQSTIKATMTKLTTQIEDLTAQLEAVKTVEQELVKAQEHLLDVTSQFEANTDSFASLKRILAKKEKMLTEIDHKDLMKDFKKLEGDKRVLHSDLSKQVELLRVNQRAILANDDRIRKLEARLLELERVLPGLFEQIDRDGLSIGKPPEVPETDLVSIGLFKDAVNDLQQQRTILADRDDRLELCDAQIEAHERKIDIMHAAQESQTAKAANEISELDRERLRLEEHVDQIAREFSAERKRLLSSRKGLA
jgi:myosin heavy subunit